MRSAVTTVLCCSAVLLAVTAGEGQEPAKDPRVGLKGGLRDAGQAARNMELVASLPKPSGFFDPDAPEGDPTAPETAPAATASPGAAPAAAAPAAIIAINSQSNPP